MVTDGHMSTTIRALCLTMAQCLLLRFIPIGWWLTRRKTASLQFLPDGSKTAFVRDNNLWVKDAASGKEKQLTTNGTIGNYYSSYIRWSPGGSKIATCRIRPAEKRYVSYVESSARSRHQPILHKQEYAKPGDELRFKVLAFSALRAEWLLCRKRLCSLSNMTFTGLNGMPTTAALCLNITREGTRTIGCLKCRLPTVRSRPLVEESHDKYVNYSRIFRHILEDGKRIIWSDERDNYNHLYMYDRATGKPSHQITKGTHGMCAKLCMLMARREDIFLGKWREQG